MALKTRSAPPATLDGAREFAAAQEVNLGERSDQSLMRSLIASSQYKAERAWKWFDNIGEVHYGITRSARIAGYARLFPVTIDASGNMDEISDGLPADIVGGIFAPYGGTRGLIDRYYTLMKVPGDSWLTRVRENTDGTGPQTGYHFASPDELDVTSFSRWRPGKGQIKWITLPGGDGNGAAVRTIANDDLLGRVWSPSRRFINATDTALAAMDTECETLFLLTKTMKAKLMSRFASAGLLVLPPGLALAKITASQEQIAGQEIDDVMNFLIAAMQRNMTNWDRAAAKMPILLRAASADDIDKIKHITLDRELFETDLQMRQELIARILQGLDSNQDQTKGTSDQNHFGVWAAADEERRIAVQPDLEQLCWALTKLVLRRRLLDDGMSPERVMTYGVWFDLSKAAVRSNQQEDARQAYDRILVSDAAARRMAGIDERDAPSEQELVRGVGKQVKNPVLALHTGKISDIDWEKANEWGKSTGPAPDSPADDPEAGPGEGDPGSPDDRETDVPRSQRPA